MEAFSTHKGLVVPLDRANIDTDAIIPKQFLKSIKRSGFGQNVFDAWRYCDHGEPGMDCSQRALNPDFVLNQPRFQGASILLTQANFGCGSSREHAPWALLDYGFRVIIAPSFAEIFYNNAIKNGLLPVVLKQADIEKLFGRAKQTEPLILGVELDKQQVQREDGVVYYFDIEPFAKYCLLQGLDEIGLTLQSAEEIRAFEQRRRHEAPWLFGV